VATEGVAEAVLAQPEVFIADIDFAEGLRWYDGELWYSDMYRGVFAVSAAGARRLVLALEHDQPSGLGWLPDGRLLIVAMLRRQVLCLGAHATAPTLHSDLSLLTQAPCNDMVVATDGTAYVGTFGFDAYDGEPRRPGLLIRVAPTGAATVAARDLHFPNGCVITPDGTTLIVGETHGHCYTAFSIGQDGALSGRRLWADLGSAHPDGCTQDADGGIWYADTVGGCVARVGADGAVSQRIPLPQRAFACALGGPWGRTLFIATATGVRARDFAGAGTGRIWRVDVEVPHAGLP
jgi:sugar lactone lactonase YvrE